jgi:predicted transcriptional regulator
MDRLLEETFRELDVKDITSLNIQICEHSSADVEENAYVYRKTNEILLSMLQEGKSLGGSTHITGEMRALADPPHRRVCRENWNLDRSRLNVVAYLPTKYRTFGRDIWAWNLKSWEKKEADWMNHLDAFDLLANAKVNLFALQKLEKIHYSVFGDRYILLQSKHSHGTHAKPVWLLESTSLVEVLAPKTERTLEKAEYINSRIFKEFTLAISSSTALHILFSLLDHGKIEGMKFRASLKKDMRLFQESYIEDLKAVGFIKEDGGVIQITEAGKDYLKLF